MPAKPSTQIMVEADLNSHSPYCAAEEQLLLMACSATKHNREMPAVDLYRGVMYQTYKTHLQAFSRPYTVILSAEHGFIAPYRLTAPYERRMTTARADELVSDLDTSLAAVWWPKGIRQVFMAGGADYRRVMRAGIGRLMETGHIRGDATVKETHGGIGQQRQQLGQHLQAIPESTNIVGRHPNGNALYGSAWGIAVGDPALLKYKSTHQGETLQVTIIDLFIGPRGPSAKVQIHREFPPKFKETRWVGISDLEKA